MTTRRSTERLAAVMRRTESTALLLTGATAARVVCIASRTPELWHARRATALRRAGRDRAAVREYRLALAGRSQPMALHNDLGATLERLGELGLAAVVYGQAAVVDPERGVWHANRSRCLTKLGEHEAAIDALRLALQREGDPAWHAELSRLLDAQGDTAGSFLAALAAARAGDHDGRGRSTVLERSLVRNPAAAIAGLGRAIDRGAGAEARHQLARFLTQLAMFEDARAEIACAMAASDNPDLRVAFADIAIELARWQGSVVELPGNTTPAFRPAYLDDDGTGVAAVDRVALLTAARDALRESLADRPGKARLLAKLGQLEQLRGDHLAAIDAFNRALAQLERSDQLWALRSKLPWQFRLEASHAASGSARVDDPLFACSVRGTSTRPPAGAIAAPGVYEAQFRTSGLVVEGFLLTDRADRVEVRINDVLVRTVRLSADASLPRFTLPLHRSVVEMLPPNAEVTVTDGAGRRLIARGGASALELTVPHGHGTLVERVSRGRTLDKKGSLQPTTDETRLIQDRYLELYDELNTVFEERIGRSIFVLYGTLLGVIREGDLIPGDDDFDAGYTSDEADPVAVKRETIGHILELLRAGYDVSLNRRGRLFRASVDRPGFHGLHLDLRPVWFNEGRLWAHNHASFPSDVEDFEPLATMTVRGIDVRIPNRPEVFLEGHYGPGWKVPDPGFMYYTADIDPQVIATLRRALITPKEIHAVEALVQREAETNPRVGRFTSIGSQELYPLRGLLD